MAKKSMVEREKKRQRLILKYREKRRNLLSAIKTSDSFSETFINLKVTSIYTFVILLNVKKLIITYFRIFFYYYI